MAMTTKAKRATSAAKTKLLPQTPSQTVGPFFAYGLTPTQYSYPWNSLTSPRMATEETPGQRIRIEGRVLDGKGVPVTDAMIEIRQADASGQLDPKPGSNTGFTGFGRCGTGTEPDGLWFFDTVKPGATGPSDAPHLSVIVTMRGLLMHAFTRIYFDDETEANAKDTVLKKVPTDRRRTLIAKRLRAGLYRLDIHMQGKNETVFFDV
jgi:protocatechuate 3,4-dioxygenase, alpha subunit